MIGVLLIALAACTPASVDRAASEPIAGSAAAITGGAPETGYPAVFSLAYDGAGGCTGTCVTPRVGVTAKHCVEGESAATLTALFGDTEATPDEIIQVVDLVTAPDADIAALAFETDCPATIPRNRTSLTDHIGERAVMVGFGVTTESAGDAGIKRSGTATLFSLDPAEVRGLRPGELATSNVPAGTCNGDSGGPTFMTLDGVEQLVGVTSRGSLRNAFREWPCGYGQSIAVRVDSYAGFLGAFIADHDPGGEAPESEPSPPDAGSPDGGGPPPPRPDAAPGGADAGAGDPGGAGGCDVTGRDAVRPLSLLVLWSLVLLARRRRAA